MKKDKNLHGLTICLSMSIEKERFISLSSIFNEDYKAQPYNLAAH